MNGWLNWREIEQQNDWGSREQTDAMGDMWNKDTMNWDARWKKEEAFTKAQAAALDLLPSDSVLDIGCGTGPLAINIAPRVRKVIAQDYGIDMLRVLMENAMDRGLRNVETLRGNWHTMEPGRDLPICDVAIARWSPAQGNILKMSRCATRFCYSIMTCANLFEEDGFSHGGFWCRSTTDDSLNRSPRPCSRKYGFNVHFNLLYDHGANPSISYVSNNQTINAPTKKELVAIIAEKFIRQKANIATGNNQEPKLPSSMERSIFLNKDGSWYYEWTSRLAILGWNPNELVY